MGASNGKTLENVTYDNGYLPKTDGYRVWLFGDSILDNAYWNGVGKDMTSEQLKKMLVNVEVRDRSTEELDSQTMLECLLGRMKYQVRQPYVENRNAIGCPYDGADRFGKVDL